MCKRFPEGTKHSESRTADYEKTKESLTTGIGNTTSFLEWKQTVTSAINEKTKQPTKLTTENSKNTLKLKDEIITEEFKMLNIKFGVAPIDNASGNIVCLLKALFLRFER